MEWEQMKKILMIVQGGLSDENLKSAVVVNMCHRTEWSRWESSVTPSRTKLYRLTVEGYTTPHCCKRCLHDASLEYIDDRVNELVLRSRETCTQGEFAKQGTEEV